jgi:hypothetical protein
MAALYLVICRYAIEPCSGNRVKVKHIRDKTELPDIDRNDNYDFELQDTVLLPNEVKVLPVSITTFDMLLYSPFN